MVDMDLMQEEERNQLEALIEEDGRFTVKRYIEVQETKGVFAVYDEKDGGTKALKIVNLSDSAQLKAEKEWQVWRRINETGNTSHVVRLYEGPLSLATAWGTLMELGNHSLHRQIEAWREKKSVLSTEDVRSMVSQIGGGLHAAHAVAYSHNDLKPKNIIAFRIDNKWVLKIGDFANSDQGSLITSSQKGTPGFMAPEGWMVAGGECKYDRRSDIYSLGVIVCLLSHPEFKIPFEGLEGKIFFEHISDKKQKGLFRYLDSAGFSDAVRNTILQAMHPSPDRRFQTVDEFMIALRGKSVIRPLDFKPALDEYEKAFKTLDRLLSDANLHKGPYGTSTWKDAGEVVEMYRTVLLPLDEKLHAMDLGSRIAEVERLTKEINDRIEQEATKDMETAHRVLDANYTNEETKKVFNHLYRLTFSWGPPLSARDRAGKTGRDWYTPKEVEDKVFKEAIEPKYARWMGL